MLQSVFLRWLKSDSYVEEKVLAYKRAHFKTYHVARMFGGVSRINSFVGYLASIKNVEDLKNIGNI
jgi:hypothetical protein